MLLFCRRVGLRRVLVLTVLLVDVAVVRKVGILVAVEGDGVRF